MDDRRCSESGADSYGVKPEDFERFAEVVSDLGLYWLTRNEAPPRRPESA